MPEAYVTQDLSEYSIIFIHSSLDEVGLNASEFRVYAHLSRRAGTKGKTWPGVDSIAKTCKMHKETAISAIRELENRNMIFADRRPGKTTIYRLTSPSSWSVVGNGERSEIGNGVVGNGERTRGEIGNVSISKKGNPKKCIQKTDDAFWKEVTRTYDYLDVDAEKKKMEGWLLTQPKRKFTKKFAINWLNRQEKPMTIPKKNSSMFLSR